MLTASRQSFLYSAQFLWKALQKVLLLFVSSTSPSKYTALMLRINTGFCENASFSSLSKMMQINCFLHISFLPSFPAPHQQTPGGGTVGANDQMSSVDDFLSKYNSYLQQLQSPSSAEGSALLAAARADNTCPICLKTYSTKHSMRRHMLMHKPFNRRFQCDVCGKLFNWPGNLKTHLQTIHNMRVVDFKYRKYRFPLPSDMNSKS